MAPFTANQRHELLTVREITLLDLENELPTVGHGTRDSRAMRK